MNETLYPGTKVLVDRKDLATVRQCFPKGSTSYLFPHAKVDFDRGDRNVAVALTRVQKVEA